MAKARVVLEKYEVRLYATPADLRRWADLVESLYKNGLPGCSLVVSTIPLKPNGTLDICINQKEM